MIKYIVVSYTKDFPDCLDNARHFFTSDEIDDFIKMVHDLSARHISHDVFFLDEEFSRYYE